MNDFSSAKVTLNGTILIEASAGTGKTWNITLLFLRLLIEKGFSLPEILVVTFTEAATAELKDRIRARVLEALRCLTSGEALLGDDPLHRILRDAPSDARQRLEDAIVNFDTAAIHTIHGFCHRVLRENVMACGVDFDMEIDPGDDRGLERMVREYWLRFMLEMSPLMARYFRDKKVSVDHFAALARTLTTRPDLKVIAPGVRPGAEGRFLEVFAQARQQFQESREAVHQLLTCQKSLDGRRYRADRIVTWFSQMAEWFEAVVPGRVPDPGKEKWFYFCATEIKQKIRKNAAPLSHPFLETLDVLRDAIVGLENELVIADLAFIDDVRSWLSQRSEREGTLSYDDLLTRVSDALDAPESGLSKVLSERYRAALIDEFQDTDSVQFQIFEQVFVRHNRPLFMIGDPKQSIFAFRGGDVFAYMNAAKQAAAVFTLRINWRSDPGLLSCVNAIFAEVPLPFGYEAISFSEALPVQGRQNAFCRDSIAAPPFAVVPILRTDEAVSKGDLLEIVADDLVQLLDGRSMLGGRPVVPGDVAVLVRTNRQGTDVRRVLARRGIPAVVSGQDSVYQTPAAMELYQILTAVSSPRRWPFLLCALSTKAFGFAGSALRALSMDRDASGYWCRVFEDLKETFDGYGLVRMMETLLRMDVPGQSGGLSARVLSRPSGERYLTDFLHVAELLEQRGGEAGKGLHGVLRDLEAAIQDCDDHSLEVARTRLETEADAVQIVTVHKSKGLQYNVVYLPYLWDSQTRLPRTPLVTFHDPGNHYSETGSLRGGVPEAAAWNLQEQEAEERRLLYVALTRARHVCRVAMGAFDGLANSALGQLLFRSASNAEKNPSLKTDEGLRQAVQPFLDRTGGAAQWCDEAPTGAMWTPVSEPREVSLVARRFSVTLPAPSRLMSFSSLSRYAGTASRGEQGRLEDAEEWPVDEPGVLSEVSQRDLPGAETGWEGVDRGNTFGLFLHQVYECTDFDDATGESLERAISDALGKYGFDSAIWVDRIRDLVWRTLQTPLPGVEEGLRDIPASDRWVELSFRMPVLPASRMSLDRLMSAMTMAAEGDYADWIAGWPGRGSELLQGALGGVMDLVFRRDGRWYIADYKSNDLGSDLSGYTRAALAADMARHHYYLQYHLYLAALHRYLSIWQPDYDYEKHMGGVLYLYVRGMTPAGGGVFSDCPPKARIEALCDVLDVTGGRL